MKLEAIIVSFDYSDLLSITLPKNKDSFDRIVVYTKPHDTETQRVCALNGVECITTDSFTKDGAKFNRGAVYNEALRTLRFNEWVCLMDSDIIVIPDFHQHFRSVNPDKECFYGVRRYDVQTPEQYRAVSLNQNLLKDEITLFRGFGYGYLQIFHYDSSIFQQTWNGQYPESFSCSESDWVFRNQWGEEIWDPPFNLAGHQEKNVQDRGTGLLRCLPFHCLHLGVTGINSTERKTERWSF
jgi:hypothetical protein